MKTIIISLTLSIVSFIANAQANIKTTKGNTITVTVPVNTDEGKVGLALYEEHNFMKDDPFRGARAEIKNGKSIITFENIPDGEYAITIYHDKNNNNQMDFSLNKMPLENYGASNNVMSFGPPMWSDAKFAVNGEDVAMEIRL
ncbi:hypothetical protein ULMS_13930 [Patiriisocius marinistellae]|uniref:DUF2141 domain-containing protein n=1 Tax=Patiriisocius marinistellae TaxID=2494560 RepID=A0A5J4G0N1_9FLAO|nr:DUF2141 domain-containing protein [Patiriisocius marinistellae]GEQ85885.1 hypothetical protein ULMS_13930 [Patiriisocius marinistellae]